MRKGVKFIGGGIIRDHKGTWVPLKKLKYNYNIKITL